MDCLEEISYKSTLECLIVFQSTNSVSFAGSFPPVLIFNRFMSLVCRTEYTHTLTTATTTTLCSVAGRRDCLDVAVGNFRWANSTHIFMDAEIYTRLEGIY
jgi:hypothetical protein